MIIIIITNNDICFPKFDLSLYTISTRYFHIPLPLNIHSPLPRRNDIIPIYHNLNIHIKL